MPGQVTEMGFAMQPPASLTDPVSQVYGQISESNSPPASLGARQLSTGELVRGLGSRAQGIVDATGLNGMNGSMNGQAQPDTELPFDPTDPGELLIDVDIDEFNTVSKSDKSDALVGEPQEPCGLTMAEWQAHQAQMVADKAASQRQNMINLALAAGAGFVISRLLK